jgi:hypothetical protein
MLRQAQHDVLFQIVYTTTFTMRPGTTITFFGVFPSAKRAQEIRFQNRGFDFGGGSGGGKLAPRAG